VLQTNWLTCFKDKVTAKMSRKLKPIAFAWLYRLVFSASIYGQRKAFQNSPHPVYEYAYDASYAPNGWF
jgi:hypothetical protein